MLQQLLPICTDLLCNVTLPLLSLRGGAYFSISESGLSVGLLWPVNAVEVIYSHPSLSMGIGSRTPPLRYQNARMLKSQCQRSVSVDVEGQL